MAKDQMSIRGVNDQLKQDLKNIADNLGDSVSSLIKPKLRELRDSYPEHLRKPKSKY